jgi:hypothetical protein
MSGGLDSVANCQSGLSGIVILEVPEAYTRLTPPFLAGSHWRSRW